MQITLNQIKKIVGGTYQGDAALLKKKIKRISINSHDIHKDDLFIGIKGEKFDGDQFASDAIRRGVCCWTPGVCFVFLVAGTAPSGACTAHHRLPLHSPGT